jgi:nucleotide-binding universal stress UspA family protein
MNQLKNILVGVDFSEASRCALEQAVRLAKLRAAQLHALHVVEYLQLDDAAWAGSIPPEELERQAVDEARQGLHRWLKQAGAGPEVEACVEVGSPWTCLERCAARSNSDLLVLGVRGTSLLPSGAGTVATRCLRQGFAKVLLTDERQGGPFRRIVTAVDFSEHSREALIQAARVAAGSDCEVHVVHVFTGSWGRLAFVPDAWEVDPVLAREYRKALEQRLREFVEEVGIPGCHGQVLEAGSHGQGLAAYARQVHADLVILGMQGRGSIGRVLLGSTVERLLREIPCSALVVRSRMEKHK